MAQSRYNDILSALIINDNNNLKLTKIRLNEQDWYDIPVDYQPIDLHNEFKKAANLSNLQPNGYRTSKLKVYNSSNLINEHSRKYLDDKNRLILNIPDKPHIVLSKEQIYHDESADASLLNQSKRNLSSNELFKRFKSYDEDDGELLNLNSTVIPGNRTAVVLFNPRDPLIPTTNNPVQLPLNDNNAQLNQQQINPPTTQSNLIDTLSTLNQSNQNLNSIYHFINEIKTKFGKFVVFNQSSIECELWIDSLEKYLLNRSGSCADVMPHFYLLIGDEFKNWYFTVDKTTDWPTFRKSFIQKAINLEYDYYNLVNLKKGDFLSKIKADKIADTNSCDDKPMFTFIHEKMKIIKRVYPTLGLDYSIRQTLSMLDDLTTYQNFRTYQNDLQSLLSYANYIDDLKRSIN